MHHRSDACRETIRINLVRPPWQYGQATAEICGLIAENAPLTVAAAKFAVQQALKDPAERDMAKAAQLVEAYFASADRKEGRRAFMEKRKPNFTGR